MAALNEYIYFPRRSIIILLPKLRLKRDYEGSDIEILKYIDSYMSVYNIL